VVVAVLLVVVWPVITDVLKPIIRSSITAVAASGFTVGEWW
jgi:hypothetical protein